MLRYDAVARRLILPLKYQDRSEIAVALAHLMYRHWPALFKGVEVIVPVPLHPARLRQRRYNQAALLATSLAKHTGIPARLDLLRRCRPTRALAGMSASQRREELLDAILLKPGAQVAGRVFMLVDDVITTGTTAHHCALALRAGGAARVEVLTIARVEDPRQS